MGTVNAGLFTSTSDDWPTPRELFETLAAEFRFSLDVCASRENTKCRTYFDRQANGLAQPWTGVAWMNPPYGRQIGWWVEKAWRSSLAGATVVALLPARTDTGYWHDYVMRAAEVRLIRGRLHFTGERHDARVAAGDSVAHNAPFPSAVVVFRPGHIGPPALSAVERDGRPVVATYPASVLDFGASA